MGPFRFLLKNPCFDWNQIYIELKTKSMLTTPSNILLLHLVFSSSQNSNVDNIWGSTRFNHGLFKSLRLYLREKNLEQCTLKNFRVNYFTWETYNESLMWADSLAAPTNSRPNVPLGILGESRALIRFFYEFDRLTLTHIGVLSQAEIIISALILSWSKVKIGHVTFKSC